MTKVPAFSLIEMLVVMLLSSMVVGIIYVVYLTISSYQRTLIDRQVGFENISALFYQLRTDVNDKSLLLKTDQGMMCYGYKIGSQVEYVFFEDHILRKQLQVTDTFCCTRGVIKFLYNRDDVTRIGHPIDEILFQMDFNYRSLTVHLVKDYDASALVGIRSDSAQFAY